jgi:antitoxin (DNA-binding transcriptional repressor) of toxin-antitoxin stability system
MSTISVEDIQRDLLAFFKRIEAGEAFIVVRGQRPLAEVRPLGTASTPPRPFGLCAGEFTVSADFDQALPEDVLKEFENGLTLATVDDAVRAYPVPLLAMS